MSASTSFERHFERAQRRLRGRAVLLTALRVLPWLEAVWLGLFAARYFRLFALPTLETLAALATLLAAVLFWTAWRAPMGPAAALVLDHRLGTREIVTTARESPAGDAPRHTFRELARQRAAAALSATDVAAALPMPGWRGFRPAILGLAAIFLAGFLPPLGSAADAATATPDPVLEDTAEALTEELQPLAEGERPEALDMLGQFEDTLEDMKSGELQTVEDALVALHRLEESLGDWEESTPQGAESLVEELGAAPLSADMARALTEGDLDALGQSLDRMAGALSAAEAMEAARRRELETFAERMSALADLLEQSGGQELAAPLRELAEALQLALHQGEGEKGEGQQAEGQQQQQAEGQQGQQAEGQQGQQGEMGRAVEILGSDELAEALRIAALLAGDEAAMQDMAELLQHGRYLLGKSGRPGALGQGKPQKLGEGAGPHPGTTSTNRRGEAYRTGSPVLRDRQTGGTSERSGRFEALYDSQLERGEVGDRLRVDGHVGADGELLSRVGRGLGFDDGTSLPLQPLGPAAAGDQERAMDLEDVPLGYRGLVRGYFERQQDEPR